MAKQTNQVSFDSEIKTQNDNDLAHKKDEIVYHNSSEIHTLLYFLLHKNVEPLKV